MPAIVLLEEDEGNSLFITHIPRVNADKDNGGLIQPIYKENY